MLHVTSFLQNFAANEYNCGAYGANAYNTSCVAGSQGGGNPATNQGSGFLADTGDKILLAITAAAVVLFVSLLARHIIRRRSQA